MDTGFFVSFLPLVALPLMMLSVAWNVAVLVLLFKIWRRVKHLPMAG